MTVRGTVVQAAYIVSHWGASGPKLRVQTPFKPLF
jgi:hypothetical protein